MTPFRWSARLGRTELADDHGKSANVRSMCPLSTKTHSMPSDTKAGIMWVANDDSGGKNPFEYPPPVFQLSTYASRCKRICIFIDSREVSGMSEWKYEKPTRSRRGLPLAVSSWFRPTR